MSYKRSINGGEKSLLPPCMYLRSKAIYVTGDPDPKCEEEMGSTRFDCWCNKTQYELGPDQSLVDRTQCVEGRDCYVPRA